MTNAKTLYEEAKRCYELLKDNCCGSYAMIGQPEYEEAMELLEGIIFLLEWEVK
jgi:hypothetical protein